MNKLNEEELINVSGGSISQVLDDVKHLKAKGLIAKDYNLDEPERWIDAKKVLREAWEKAGVVCVANYSEDNKYYRGVHEITREEALKALSSI